MNSTGVVVGSFFVLLLAGCDMQSPAFQELSDSSGNVGKKAGLPGEIIGTSDDSGGGGTSADASADSSSSTLARFSGDGSADGQAKRLNIVMGKGASSSSSESAGSKGGGNSHGKSHNGDDGDDDRSGSSTSSSHTESISSEDRRECAEHFGGHEDDVKGVSDSGAYALHDNDIIALRVTGNGPELTVELGDDDDREMHIRGVCVFVAGNQSSVKIRFKSDCDGLLYKGRGNQSRGVFTVDRDHYLDRVEGSLAGNQSYLEVGGDGHYPQGDVERSGNGSNYICR